MAKESPRFTLKVADRKGARTVIDYVVEPERVRSWNDAFSYRVTRNPAGGGDENAAPL